MINNMTLLTILTLITAATAVELPQQKWVDPANWDSLEKGMLSSTVRSRLGEPVQIESGENLAVWYYQSVPVRSQEKAVSRPEFGFVRFKADNSPGGRMVVYSYTEPDWLAVKSALDEYQARIETRRLLSQDRQRQILKRKQQTRDRLISRRIAAEQERKTKLKEFQERKNQVTPVQASVVDQEKKGGIVTFLKDNYFIAFGIILLTVAALIGFARIRYIIS